MSEKTLFERLKDACPDRNWLRPGMLVNFRKGEWGRVVRLSDAICVASDEEIHLIEWLYSEDIEPDFEDAATIGCLTQIAREAHVGLLGFWVCAPAVPGDKWEVVVEGCVSFRADTQAEALIASLEAAVYESKCRELGVNILPE